MAYRAKTAQGHFRSLFEAGTASGLTDAQLVERVATASSAALAGESAFEALVARHGPMVLGVCRRALDDPRDVEDAFQATFLVLVRKAGAVRVDDSLGRWLYGVARRVAGRARAVAGRREALRAAHPGEERTVPPPDAERAELLAALDDELGRLPEKYRAPLLLCYLEGLTHPEAARRLRWPVGTVKGRLAQARTLLRTRLTRRGLAPSASLLAAAIEAEARPAVPPALADAAADSARQLAAGGTAGAASASATVAALTKGTLKIMFLAKLKTAALGLLAALPLATAAGVLAHAKLGDEPGATGGRVAAPAAGVREGPNATGQPRADAEGVPIFSEVGTATAITFVVPDGTRVRRGDEIYTLDSRALLDQSTRLALLIDRAKAEYEAAGRAREVAEAAFTEYKGGVYQQELRTAEGTVSLAEAERKRLEDRVKWSEGMSRKGYLTREQHEADKLRLRQKVFAYEQALAKKKLLETETYASTIKELRLDVEVARAEEVAKRRGWHMDVKSQAALRQELENCRIKAPISGRLVYARWPSPEEGKGLTTVAAGRIVRRGQLLFRIVPGDPPAEDLKNQATFPSAVPGPR